jgi:hypothetical protein
MRSWHSQSLSTFSQQRQERFFGAYRPHGCPSQNNNRPLDDLLIQIKERGKKTELGGLRNNK